VLCGSVADAEPDCRCRVQGIDQPVGLEPPEVVEGAPVEIEDGRTVDAPRAPQRGLGVVRSRDVVQRVLQEVEALTHAEPGVDERQRVGGGQRARHDRGVAGPPQPFDALLYLTARRR